MLVLLLMVEHIFMLVFFLVVFFYFNGELLNELNCFGSKVAGKVKSNEGTIVMCRYSFVYNNDKFVERLNKVSINFTTKFGMTFESDALKLLTSNNLSFFFEINKYNDN